MQSRCRADAWSRGRSELFADPRSRFHPTLLLLTLLMGCQVHVALLTDVLTRGAQFVQLPDTFDSMPLILALLAARDIFFRAQPVLFGAEAPMLSTLCLLKPGDGLGSDKTVASYEAVASTSCL